MQPANFRPNHYVKSVRIWSYFGRIFPHLDSISRPNAEKYAPE